MDLTFTCEDEQFREDSREWLQRNVPREPRPEHDRAALREFDTQWQHLQFTSGRAGVSWPTEYGGRGLPLVQQMIWYEEYARAGGPYVGSSFVGLAQCGPTLIAKGTQAQRETHLRPILAGETVWCQGFSEPDAGSDLASLRTRAVVDGDDLVVNGQKIWTSFADIADYQELLVRTDSSGGKHEGITWVICDMRSPGIDVRPLRTMHGRSMFAEVFYTDVRIPLANVVGEVGQGWPVAMATLSFERGTAFIAEQIQLGAKVSALVELARDLPSSHGRGATIENDEFRRRLVRVRAEVTALRAMSYASISRAMRSPHPGPEASMVRLYFATLQQRVHRLAMDMLGARGLLVDESDPMGRWVDGYIDSFRYSITAGTTDIQRNIIGERVLGLPRDR